MSKGSEIRELEHRIELLEKDYKIMEVNIDATLRTMRSDIDGTLQEMRADIERNNTAIERGQKNQIQWTIGAVVAAVIIIIGAVGLIT